jgi:factor associated with neutral sphingomyelinase activation
MPDPSIEQMLGALGRLSSSPDIILTDRHLEALENSISSQHSKPSISLTTASSSSSTRPIGGHADEWSQISRLLPSETWKSHRQGVTSICLSSDGETLYSVSQDSSLKIYSLGEGKQLRSNNISQLALSSCALSKDQKFVAIGSWDNNIYLYSNDYGRVITTVPAHDDTVSCLTLRDNLLVSGSWDTSMKVWSISPSGISQDPLMELSCLDSTVRAVHLNMDMNLALCGSDDGMLAIADIRSGSVVRTWVAHDDAISAAQFTSDGRIISVSASGTMKVHESTGKTMFEVDVPDSFHCLATNGTRLLTGDAGSTLRSWDLLVGEEIARVKRTPESPITCIATSEFCEFVITGSEDGTLTKWTKN